MAATHLRNLDDAIKTLTDPSVVSFLRKQTNGDYFCYRAPWIVSPLNPHHLRRAALFSHVHVSRDANEHVTSLSLTNHVLSRDERHLRVDVFYFGQASLQELLAHVKTATSFLKSHPSVASLNTYLVLHFPLQLDFSSVESQLRPVVGDARMQYPQNHVCCMHVAAENYFKNAAKL